jgi:hypothetical protein
MARLIVNQGLQVIGQRASFSAGAPALIQAMCVDGGTAATNSFLATHTALSNGGATLTNTNSFASTSFSATTSSAQTIQHFSLYGTGTANFTIGRVSLHNSATPTLSSASLIGGIDQQSLLKTTDFSLQIEVDILYTSA